MDHEYYLDQDEKTSTTNTETVDTIIRLRYDLLKNGYEPIAVNGKAPKINGWQNGEITLERIATDTITHPSMSNTGLRTGRLVVIDIDLLDDNHVAEIGDVVVEQIGLSPLLRRGSKGLAMCYRMDGEPVGKIYVKTHGGVDAETGRPIYKTAVEIFGHGQVVAYGRHPDTGRDYEWVGDSEPLLTPLSALPGVTAEKLHTLADSIRDRLGELGYAVSGVEGGQTLDTEPPKPGIVEDAHDITRLFLDLIPISARGSATGYRNFNCPACGDTKKKGGFRLLASGGFEYHCFRAGCEFADTTGWQPGRKPGEREKRLYEILGGNPADLEPRSLSGAEFINRMMDERTAGDSHLWRPKVGTAGDIGDERKDGGSGEHANRPFGGQCEPERSTGGSDGFAGRAARADGPQRIIGHNAFDLINRTIPPRQWLLGTAYCRRYLSSTIGEGATGKTTLLVLRAVALASGQEISGEHIFQRCRVLYLTLEDDIDELARRVQACCRHHGIDFASLDGTLYLDALTNGTKLTQADRYGNRQPGALKDMLVEVVERRQIDLVIIDPFVKAHGAVSESDNAAIDTAVSVLTDLCVTRNLALDAPHHMRKGGGGDPGNADTARGASAFKDAVRLGYTLTRMSEAEAERYGVPEDSRSEYVRWDSGKVNIAKGAEKKWFRLVGVNLDNGEGIYPNGDTVQAMEPWEPPDLLNIVEDEEFRNVVLDAIRNAPPNALYSNDPKATDRHISHVMRDAMPSLTREQCQTIVETWMFHGYIAKTPYKDAKSRAKDGLAVRDRTGRVEKPPQIFF